MTAWRAPAGDTEFDQAMAWFASRVPVSDADRAAIPVDARSRAFWIAGVAQLDIVQQVRAELANAIEKGTGLEDFKRRVREQLSAAWGKDDSARIETIFRNATQTAYNHARWEQMRDPTVMRVRPFWLFDAVLDGRTTERCTVCNGTILSADDPWFDTSTPPLHHRCRSSLRALRRSDAEKRGITQSPPVRSTNDGFGLSPRLAQEWRPAPGSRDTLLMAELERKRADLAKRPLPPPLPATFDKTPKPPRPKPAPRQSIDVGFGKRVPLTPEQQKADQVARTLGASLEARQNASVADRRTWMLWEWVRGSNRKTPVLMKHAAIREFDLTGVPWSRGIEYSMQEADIVRTRRDLRALYEQTQAWFKRRGIRAVTLYRGVHGDADDARNSIESWTTSRTVAEQFSRRGAGGRVVKITVPITQVLVHHEVSEWVDGPFGAQEEYLLVF